MVKSVAVFEYVVGGGFSNTQLETSLVVEGYAMLRSLLQDLKRSGYWVATTLDERLASTFKLQADKQVTVSREEDPMEKLEALLGLVEGVIVIAPAFKDALYKVTRFLEKRGSLVLGSNSNAVLTSSDKRLTLIALQKLQLHTPKTKIATMEEDVDQVRLKVEEIGYPVVFKPADGVGCIGASIVKNYSQIGSALSLVRKHTKTKHFLIQEFLDGTHISVSLLSNGEKAVPLTLNMQKVKVRPPPLGLSFEGNIVPFRHRLAEKAKNAARVAVESIEGLRGYVGVDLVLTREHPYIIEINPRLTTSYLGLRKILNLELGDVLVQTSLGLYVPKKIKCKGVAVVTKTSFPFSSKLFQKDFSSLDKNIEIVVSPLLPEFSVQRKGFMLFTAYGKSLKEVKTLIKNFKQNIHGMFTGSG
ncbi:hypothetical protein DRO26_01610 [Candidatus Bathyarchaeota archaeon]|nr:MAG: hypothetical protein DRO26_01610 [Candidatus Bathyarchaeota archaeon]